MLKKLTPVLFVECVEDQLPFWVEQLGFAVRDAAGNIVTFADK